MTRLSKRSWVKARLRNSQHGFTTLELLVATIIVLLLATAAIAMISRVEVWANVAQAKTEITQISMAIEMEKYDTGSYTLNLADLVSPSAPSGINNRTWKGPYLQGNFSRDDPWKKYYLLARQDLIFQLPPSIISKDFDINFTDAAGTDTMILEAENEKKINSVTITLKNNIDGTILKTLTLNSPDLPSNYYPITLSSDNNLYVSLNGESGAGLIVVFPNLVTKANDKNPLWIISRGADKQSGGTGLNADIVWHSDYAGFQD